MNEPTTIHGLVRHARSVRRFIENEPVSMARLEALAELGRLSASAGNFQPLRYVLVNDPAKRAEVFACLGWAAYLPHWKGPEEGERPSAYIVLLADQESGGLPEVDAGIAMQSIRLGAEEMGLSGCMIASVNRDKLAPRLDIPEGLDILYVLALGKGAEEVRLEDLAPGNDIKYWRDDKDVHHVPKRSLAQVVKGRFGS